MITREKISIIIPTLNEERNLPFLLSFLSQYPCEVIIADAGSTDKSLEIARDFGVTVYNASEARRSTQLNLGASHANGQILFFIHADSIPPANFPNKIIQSINRKLIGGCFALSFDSPDKRLIWLSKRTLKNSLFTGGGDQGLFVQKEAFNKTGGYKEDLYVMEDFDLFRRLKKFGKMILLKERILVSARKYEKNHFWKVQFSNAVVFFGFLLGISNRVLHKIYSSLIN